MKESPPPVVSVVVPAYNRLATLRETLDGLAAQTLSCERFEVVVVDNGSTDGTARAVEALAESFPCRLRVFRMPGENRGPAPARNAGVREALGEVIAFTDSDCRPHPDWLARGLAAFDDPQLAFATGVVAFKPEQVDRLALFARRTVTCDFEHPTYPTANAFYRRSTFLRFSGFTEALSFPNVFGTSMEAADTDLAWRIKDAGGRNGFVADAVVYHEVQVVSPREWLMEPVRLFLVPALIKLHPSMRRRLLAFGLFFHRGSIPYYLAIPALLAVLTVRPLLAAFLPLLLLAAAAWKSRSLHPVTVLQRAVRIVLNATRIYVMAFALICGSLRFRTLVL